MSHRTRYVLVGSALVVSVGLCTGLLAYYSGSLPLRRSTIGPAELSYLPDTVTAVAYADVKDIMDSEFRQRLREFMPTGAEKNKLLEDTGIDIEHDLDRVVAGFQAGQSHDANGVVLLRGRFDIPRIERLVRQHGATVEDYRGRRILMTPVSGVRAQTPAEAGQNDQRPVRTAAVAFLEAGLIGLGDSDSLRRAIDAAESQTDVTGNGGMMKVMASVADRGNAWIVGNVDGLADARSVPDPIRSQVNGVEWFAVSADVDKAVNGFVRAECVDEQSAEQLRTVIAGALAAAKMFGARDARMAAALNALQPSGAGRTVELAFNVGPEMLELMHKPDAFGAEVTIEPPRPAPQP
jgi:hypothetical protein